MNQSFESFFACFTALLLGGCACSEFRPAYLVNESRLPLTVTLSLPVPVGVSGQAPTCRLKKHVQPLLMGKAKYARTNQFRGWPLAELSNFDPEVCEATFEVPPDKAVLVYWADPCATEVEPPVIGRLSVTDEGGRSIKLLGRDADAAFEPTSRRNRLLRIR
jgi:hypothetical protein